MVLLGDCLDAMREMDPNSVDAVVCDPPYGLGFMGKKWDAMPPGREWAEAVLRVCKPGAHLVAFGGTRTAHRLVVALEDAGWEVRDCLHWCYWSGFPKSHDVSKAIDRRRDDKPAMFKVTGWITQARDAAGLTSRAIDEAFGFSDMANHWTTHPTQPAVPTLEQWTKLIKVLGQPVPDEVAALVVRLNQRKGKPGDDWFDREAVGQHASGIRRGASGMGRGGVGEERRDIAITPDARAWEGWGTALKPAVEPATLCRKPLEGTTAANVLKWGTGALNIDACRFALGDPMWPGPQDGDLERWPANLLHVPKASRAERERGCDGLPPRTGAEATGREEGAASLSSPRTGAGRTSKGVRNFHPTVKPVRLMRWLCRLATPPGGLVLDPFAGSGSCGVAAALEGFDCLGMELEQEYLRIAEARIAHAMAYPESWVDTTPGRTEKAKDPSFRERVTRNGQKSLF